MTFSRETRRLARLARGLLKDMPPVESPPEQSGDLPPPAGAPLDRKRLVLFNEMDDADLQRSFEQAQRRVERTGPSEDLTRYQAQLDDIYVELVNRTQPAQSDQSEEPPEVEEDSTPPPPGDPLHSGNENPPDLEAAVAPDEEESDEASAVAREKRERGVFRDYPGDTPESPMV